MAPTNRIRVDGLLAPTAPPALAAALAATGGTGTVTFPGALKHSGAVAVPTVADPDYLPLVLDPDTGALEIVWLTAYTAGGTTGTILRAQEGTTGATHATGAAVVHGPTVADIGGAGKRFAVETNAASPVTIAAAANASVYPLLDNVTHAASWLDPVTSGHLTFLEAGNYFVAVDIDVNFGTPPTTGYAEPYFSDSQSDSPYLVGHTPLGPLLAGADPTFSQIAYYDAGTLIIPHLENKTDQSLDMVWARIYILKLT
jgi:hypothetical protein